MVLSPEYQEYNSGDNSQKKKHESFWSIVDRFQFLSPKGRPDLPLDIVSH